MKLTAHKFSDVLLVVWAAILLAQPAVTAKQPARQLKPTELVVRRHDKLVADGALLTAEGWKQSSMLWTSSDPYPRNGEIVVEDLSGIIGEDWVRGNRAQVETKWDDLYGSIDSSLRYKSGSPSGGSIMMARLLTLVCVESPQSVAVSAKRSDPRCAGEWKLEGPRRSREATIPRAIKYVTEMRDKSTDPVIRGNANKTIETLKHMGRGCGTASAC